MIISTARYSSSTGHIRAREGWSLPSEPPMIPRGRMTVLPSNSNTNGSIHYYCYGLELRERQRRAANANAVIPVHPRVSSLNPCHQFSPAPTPPSTPSRAAARSADRWLRHPHSPIRLRDVQRYQRQVERYLAESADKPSGSVVEDLSVAFSRVSMSLNNGSGNAASVNNNQGASMGMYSGFESSPNTSNLANLRNQSMSPALPHAAQVNGGGAGSAMAGMNAGLPMNAGHQMDINHLYEMVLELSEVLKNNRDMTRNIVTSAEELMRRASSEGSTPSLQQVNGEISAARIADLERALAKEKRLVELLKREQIENTKLISDYEAAMGIMVEQIRNYCQNNNMHFLAQKRHYNYLLQTERDAHLESRLDRDYWHAQTMKCAEMLRTAYRLRSKEEELPIRIVAGLQNEVRAYRHALGMDPEKPEEEYGYEILKDIPPGIEY